MGREECKGRNQKEIGRKEEDSQVAEIPQRGICDTQGKKKKLDLEIAEN